ncbi:hypothetical protein CLIB1444_21S00342 [[Candida] jaroonii]|uniref:Uncharacterized protein n=1 Tax=[Candida] jaroonii TaxID=467808 RepID=A0ACA9YFG4_9ASCO|nr:hypothetical protein CLIB1444_21S00342 [[Candida] jaroonii]
MQGSYKNGGLPRPYNMKPIRPKKGSPYQNFQSNWFNSPRRKALGYFFMLFLFSLSFYWLGQTLKSTPDTIYELEDVDKKLMNSLQDVDNLVGKISNEKDKDEGVLDAKLAGNMMANSKGDIGIGINEAPKGGIANEAPIVGNDEELILKGKKSTKKNDQVERILNDIESKQEIL